MNTLKATVAAASCALAASAHANPISMSVFENATNTSVLGLNIDILITQMSPGTIDFTISNTSVSPLLNAGINNIYFERTSFTLAAFSAPSIVTESAGVDFNVDNTPGAPPGGNNIGFTQSIAEFARTGGGGNRITSGENIVVRFALANAYSLSSVISSINSGGFRIATHTLSVGPNANSVSTVNRVPAPGCLAVVAGGGLIMARRRRQST